MSPLLAWRIVLVAALVVCVAVTLWPEAVRDLVDSILVAAGRSS